MIKNIVKYTVGVPFLMCFSLILLFYIICFGFVFFIEWLAGIIDFDSSTKEMVCDCWKSILDLWKPI